MSKSMSVKSLLDPEFDKYNHLVGLLEKWLIKDLESMSKIKTKTRNGEASFPMVFTMIAGMDLLGTFISGTRNSQDTQFRAFVNKFMPQQYHDNNKLTLIWRRIRNGSAHYYLLKKGIGVTKNNDRKNHFNKSRNLFYLDVLCLHCDFKKAFNSWVNYIDDNYKTDSNIASGYQALESDIIDPGGHSTFKKIVGANNSQYTTPPGTITGVSQGNII